MAKRVECLLEGCGKTWDMDPALTVACPDCRQAVGSRCRRPSEHPVPFGEVHGARDLLANEQGAYGVCPMGGCGDYARKLKRQEDPQQLLL